MTPLDILSLPEGRRLEFKSQVPTNSDLAKTVVAFANDAGGEIIIGVDDKTKSVVGIDPDSLQKMEEQISNTIYDRCFPAILPEISTFAVDDKYLMRVKVYRGSQPPYYLKTEGKLNGTYIRVGSTNRLADESIIEELERKRRNISFDSEVCLDIEADSVNIRSFQQFYKEKTSEELDAAALYKLQLVKDEQGRCLATRALILLSEGDERWQLFPNAKVECARFKGTTTDTFIDQKTIDCHVARQAEEAYDFVLRHINKGAYVEGVYTVSRWEYPINAIREVIRNAVVHRDYSLTGMDIKIAIYDDMVEITSPGLLPPSIDYSNMLGRQSDVRNKVLAPVFKRLGIIDQWGNGLRLINDELAEYNDVEMKWKEVGSFFQVSFVKKESGSKSKEKSNQENTQGTTQKTTRKTTQKTTQKTTRKILDCIRLNEFVSRRELAEMCGISQDGIKWQLKQMQQQGLIRRVGPDKGGHWEITEK